MKRPEQIRKEILLQLYASRPLALTGERMGRDAGKQGYNFTQPEIFQELQFLVDENLVLELQPKGTASKYYRIGPDGVRQYEQFFQS